MAYYSNWYKHTMNGKNVRSTNISAALEADLTPAQITVCTIQDKLVYNMEYKPISPVESNTERHTRQSTASSSSSSSSSSSNVSNSSNTFAAANVMAARFQNRSRTRTRTHSCGHARKFSSESEAVSIISDVAEDSMWDDWIVKFIEDKKTVVVDDAPMEDWIFETM